MKTSNSDCRRFFNNINTIHLELFLQKVHRMLIAINMKSDLAFIAINNNPCSVQEGSTKDNRHVVILGHLKYNKVSQNSNISNNNGHLLTDTDRYGVDLSAICRDISVGVSLFKSSLLYKEKGITLTPAPKSHKSSFHTILFDGSRYSWYSRFSKFFRYSIFKSIISKHSGDFSFRYFSLICDDVFHLICIRRHFQDISQASMQKY